MSTKTTPISVRIPPQDVEFIAGLQIDDAITPSEKIRALIKEARENREAAGDPLGRRRTLEEIAKAVREAELEQSVHSELIASVIEWLFGIFGALTTLDPEKLELSELEEELGARIGRLFLTVTRYGVTEEAPCYRPELVRELLAPVRELIALIELSESKE